MSYEFNWEPKGDPESPQVIYEAHFGPRKYQLKIGDKAEIEKWKNEIHKIHEYLLDDDKDGLKNFMKGGRYRRDVKKILEIQESEGLDEEGKKLLSISLWIMKNQSDWRGFLAAGFKLIKGGMKTLDHYLKNVDSPSCLDAAILVEFLTEIYGIKGVVKKVAGRYSHWYWESETGKVVDIWWGYSRGGLYLHKETYKNMKTRFIRSGRVTDISREETLKVKRKISDKDDDDDDQKHDD